MRFVNISTKSLQITKGLAHTHFFDKDARLSTNFSYSKRWTDSKLKSKKKRMTQNSGPKNTMTEDANCKNLKKMGNEDWLLSYCIIFIPYHFISSYADVRLSMWVYSYMAWLKVLTFTCVDYWEGFWGLLHTRGLQFCRNI